MCSEVKQKAENRLVIYQHKWLNQFLPTNPDDYDESYWKLKFSLSQKC